MSPLAKQVYFSWCQQVLLDLGKQPSMKPDRIKIKKFLLACTLNLLLVLSAIYQSDLFDKFMLQIIESELYERESKSKNDTRMSTVSLNQLWDILPSFEVCSIITRAWQLQSATGFILHAI